MNQSKDNALSTKKLQLKATKLNMELLSYLRAHCLLMYKGDSITSIKLFEPSDLPFEITVLETYQEVLKVMKSRFSPKFSHIQSEGEVEASLDHRTHFVRVYRDEQRKIWEH